MSDELTVSPVPVADWDASLSHIMDDMSGRPLNVHSLMANHPDLLNAWWNFRNHSIVGGDLGQRNVELVILRVAVHMGAWYEWAAHVERAMACGLTLDEIERVKIGADAPEWLKKDSLLLRAVDELVSDHKLSPQTHGELRQYYSSRQLMDVIAIHGMYVILGCMINTWGLSLDEHIEGKLPESVTEEKFGS